PHMSHHHTQERSELQLSDEKILSHTSQCQPSLHNWHHGGLMSSCQRRDITPSEKHTHTLTHTLSHTHTHTHTHIHSLSLSSTHTHTHSHTHPLSHLYLFTPVLVSSFT